MEIRGTRGRIVFFRAHEAGTMYGPPNDELDADVIVRVENDAQSYGFGLRDDDKLPAAQAMFALLQDAFNANTLVEIEYEYRPGCNNHYMFRVIRRA